MPLFRAEESMSCRFRQSDIECVRRQYWPNVLLQQGNWGVGKPSWQLKDNIAALIVGTRFQKCESEATLKQQLTSNALVSPLSLLLGSWKSSPFLLLK